MGGITGLVSVEDLKYYDKTDYVTIIKPLQNLVAEEVKDDFAKSLSKWGSITALRPNSLKINDRVSNVESILKLIDGNEKSEPCETYSHACQWVKATTPRKNSKRYCLTRKRCWSFPQAVPGGARKGGRACPKLKIYQIDVNEVRNEVFVSGPADIIGKARDLIEKKINVNFEQWAHA